MIKEKKGSLLTENIIFIVLNLVFFVILMVFVFSKTGSAAVLEEKYAKQIALMVDEAEQGMIIHLNMEDAINTAKKNNIPLQAAIKIQGNIVTVKLSQNGGYSYSFFNKVASKATFDSQNGQEYFFVINPP